MRRVSRSGSFVKLSNSLAITPYREVPVPRRQDVDERPCVPRLELDHFDSQPDSPRINQRFPKTTPTDH